LVGQDSRKVHRSLTKTGGVRGIKTHPIDFAKEN
jgi:hypothetical protein